MALPDAAAAWRAPARPGEDGAAKRWPGAERARVERHAAAVTAGATGPGRRGARAVRRGRARKRSGGSALDERVVRLLALEERVDEPRVVDERGERRGRSSRARRARRRRARGGGVGYDDAPSDARARRAAEGRARRRARRSRRTRASHDDRRRTRGGGAAPTQAPPNTPSRALRERLDLRLPPAYSTNSSQLVGTTATRKSVRWSHSHATEPSLSPATVLPICARRRTVPVRAHERLVAAAVRRAHVELPAVRLRQERVLARRRSARPPAR